MFFNYNNCQIRFLQSCVLLEENEIWCENLEDWKMTGKEIPMQNYTKERLYPVQKHII